MSNVNTTTFTIVVVLFVIVTGLGFIAARSSPTSTRPIPRQPHLRRRA
jgi:hypothetical protein